MGDCGMTQLDLPEFQLPQPKKRDLELLRFSVIQERGDYVEDIGYSPALFSQVSLPYKDPRNQEIWTRKNGDLTLKVTPWTVQDPTTLEVERRYPFGITPRLLIAYLTTEAKRTNSRTVELGGSLSAFMRNLGMKHTGPNAKRLRDHMERFFGATITFEGTMTNAAGEGTRRMFFNFADQFTVWDPSNRPQTDITHRIPWLNEVHLSELFFREVDSRPVPVDMNALRELGSSPFSWDVYLWLAHRMSWVKKDCYVPWNVLEAQFGAQYAHLRQFKAAFLGAIVDVKKVYPGLNVDEAKGCFVMKPSRTPIAKIQGARPATVKFAGDRFALEA